LKNIYKSLALAAALVCGTANAAVVFENGTDGAVSWAGGNNPFTYQIVTNSFALSDDAVITSLTYDALTTSSTEPVTSVLVNFYANDNGSVGDLLYTGTYTVASTATIGSYGGYSITGYTVDLSDISLDAGSYYLGLEVGPQQWDEHWVIPSTPDASGTVGSDGWAHYFRLESNVSSVPEPGSLALMMLGLGAVGAAGLRRKAKQQ
jgi:hypothetical protein